MIYYFILFLLILIILCFILSFTRKIRYYKCPHKKNGILIKNILDKYKYSTSNIELYLPCGYNNVENELDNLLLTDSIKFIFGIKNCDKIVSKNNLWNIINDKKLMPNTYYLEKDYHKIVDKLSRGKVFIAKKNLQRKEGLKFIVSENDLITAHEEDYKIVQKFYLNTFLIKNRKVNLRVYLTIVCKNNKIYFYLYQNGKCLYTKQMNNNQITFENQITSFGVGPEIYQEYPHDFKELSHYLNWNRVWENLKNNLKEVCQKIAPVLRQPRKFNGRVSFQLFGLDYIVKDNLDVYLLEINKGPDMIPKCEKDTKLKKKVYEDTFALVNLKNNVFQKNLYQKIYQYDFL